MAWKVRIKRLRLYVEIVIDACFLVYYNKYEFRKHINADNKKRICIGGIVI